MSAFLVSEKTINVIVATLSAFLNDNHFLQEKASALSIDVSSTYWQEKLADALFKLNCEALHQRYNDSEFPLFQFQNAHDPSLIQVYKSLQCFLYQCSEGNVPEKKLFKFMEEFSHILANRIVITLPAYDKANWD